MPTYEYECQSCGAKVEETRSLSESSKLDKCQEDGGNLIRKYNISVTFKGSGFYANDKNKQKGE